MTTEVGVPGKNILYLNLHQEGTSADSTCSVNELWSGPLLKRQSDYLVAISRFEVPMNRVAITKQVHNAVEIYRYYDHNIVTDMNAKVAADTLPNIFRLPERMPFTEVHESLDDLIAEEKDEENVPPNNSHTAAVQRITNEPSGPEGENVRTDENQHSIGFQNPEKMVAAILYDDAGLLANGHPLPENRDVSVEDMDNYFQNCEMCPALHVTEDNPIDMPPCHTIYEFLKLLNSKINDRLLYVDPDNTRNGIRNITAFKNNHTDFYSNPDNLRFNTFTKGPVNESRAENETDPVAFFRIKLNGDFKFCVEMNHQFASNYYIKLHPELFNMMQFSTITGTDVPDARRVVDETGTRHLAYNRNYLHGRRFMADRLCGADRNFIYVLNKHNVANGAGYQITPRQVQLLERPPFDDESDARTLYAVSNANKTLQIVSQELVKKFEAPISAADSLNRVKQIVFKSSLATKSEGSSGNTYQHFLTDFTVPTETQFSWDYNSYQTSAINEQAASELTFTNANPSSGRLLLLTDPSPLYEIKLVVEAKCWDFENEKFYFESIPLPPGSTFTCKIVFISKNEIYTSKRPDNLHH